jgi:hypothetical protein
MKDLRRCDQRYNHQNNSGPTLEPGRPAEECPPNNYSQPAKESAKQSHCNSVGYKNRENKSQQPLKDYDDYTRPQPQLFLLIWDISLLISIHFFIFLLNSLHHS